MKNNRGIYSNEHEKFLKHIMKNDRIRIDGVDKSTIKEVDKYIKNLSDISKDVLEESIKLRVKDIELDLSSYIGVTISIASLEVAVIPILLKYINVPIIIYLTNGFEIIFAVIIVYLVVKINSFYFKRKEELLFNNFVLNRISK